MKKHISAQPSHYNKEADHYDAFNEERSRIINQTIEFILKKYHLKIVLDLTCGTGSQVFWLINKGFIVTGSDINTKMLSIAKKKAQKQNIKVSLIKGDMRTSVLGSFDAVITIFNAIGHLTQLDFEKAMCTIHANLNDNGIYIFDIFNLQYLIYGDNITALTIDWLTITDNSKVRNIQYSTIDAIGVLASYDITYEQKGSNAPTIKRSSMTLQVYSAEQLKEMLARNGFNVLEIMGVDGSVFDPIASERMLVVAQKI